MSVPRSGGARALRVHPTSDGLDTAQLTPGHDVVLDIAPAHGMCLPDGVPADDHLDQPTRWEIHRGGLEAVAHCRDVLDAALTVDGLCLPWLWELAIERSMVAVLGQAEALRRALARSGADAIVLVGPDDRTRRIAAAVAAAAAVAVQEEPAVARAADANAPRPASATRRRLVGAARELGFPSRLRRGSVLVVSYWPLMALVDRMLADRGRRPAVMLRNPPTGPRRALRMASQGGWIGTPGPTGRRRAERAAAAAIAAARATAPGRLERSGLDLGPAAHAEVLVIACERAASDLAMATLLRRQFRRTPPDCIVSAWDVEPGARLVVREAQAAGIRTLALAHGACLLPQTLADLDICDESLLWSHAVAPPITDLDRPIHVVGYPEPHAPAPPTRAAPPAGRRSRVLVLAQPALPDVGLTSPRIAMRQFTTAIEVLRERCPHTQIVLRPHPSGGQQAEDALAARFPDTSFEIDRTSPIRDVLAGCDLCIGTITAATLQAALVGTPVIALNLMGFAWSWPLGGDSTVPVAHDAAELAAWLERWAAGTPLPGREELLSALGADAAGGDPTERILAILDHPPAPPSGPAGQGSSGASGTSGAKRSRNASMS